MKTKKFIIQTLELMVLRDFLDFNKLYIMTIKIKF